MKPSSLPKDSVFQEPILLEKTTELAEYLKTLDVKQIASIMKISVALAEKTHQLIQSWSSEPDKQSLAIDTFKGDIYSGLQVPEFNQSDREYANKHLIILSGLYGMIRPFDAIHPYRLEMMYRLIEEPYKNLYKYWGEDIAKQLPKDQMIANLSSVEYSKMVTPFVDPSKIFSPQFFTKDKNGVPKFVTVHSKIARGAFARWMIQNQIEKPEEFLKFDLLGYKYSKDLSAVQSPAFVADEFGGLGLSLRLT